MIVHLYRNESEIARRKCRIVFRVPAAISVLLTFHAVCFGWILFRAQSLADVQLVLAGLTDFATPVYAVSPLVCLVMIAGFASHVLGASQRLAQVFREKAIDTQVAFWLAVVVGIFFLGSQTEQFIYFQF